MARHPDIEKQQTFSPEDVAALTDLPAKELAVLFPRPTIERDELGALLAEVRTRFDLLKPAGRQYLPAEPLAWARSLRTLYENSVAYPASVSPPQGALLRSLAANIAPKIAVEIGCFIGVSTLWLGAGIRESGSYGMLYSIDLFTDKFPDPPWHYGFLQDTEEFVVNAVRQAELYNVTLLKANSRDCASLFSKNQIPIDLLFIDGDHTYEGCSGDFLSFSPMLAKGGYLILHDIYPEECGHEGPRRVIDEFLRTPEWELTEIKTSPHNFGMAIARKV